MSFTVRKFLYKLAKTVFFVCIILFAITIMDIITYSYMCNINVKFTVEEITFNKNYSNAPRLLLRPDLVLLFLIMNITICFNLTLLNHIGKREDLKVTKDSVFFEAKHFETKEINNVAYMPLRI